jgi:hypothetical protein
MIIAGEKAVYHVMSRTALDGFALQDVEKEFMLDFKQMKQADITIKIDQKIDIALLCGFISRYGTKNGEGI